MYKEQITQITYVSPAFSSYDNRPWLTLAGTNVTRIKVDQINWIEYTHAPEVTVSLGYNEQELLILFQVFGQGLRTLSPGDGHYVHTDSCVEFFMQRELGESYINFEFNAAGVCYASHHHSIKESTPFTPEEYSTIQRQGTFIDKKMNDEKIQCRWELFVRIPWTTMGYQPKEVPQRLWGNFYKCGDETAHPHYLSWAPIVGEPKPAFHRPQFFGEITLVPTVPKSFD